MQLELNRNLTLQAQAAQLRTEAKEADSKTKSEFAMTPDKNVAEYERKTQALFDSL